MSARILVTIFVALTSTLALNTVLWAQTGVSFSGQLTNSLSDEPITGATVQIQELDRTTTSGEDGGFVFDDIPPGNYHLFVHAEGYSTRRVEATVGELATPHIDLRVDPELHFNEITTVTANAQNQFEVYQPTAVLAGQDLSKQLGISLGATLESQPGVAVRSLGPAPSRPVIRGLDGDRVQILQDGQRMGDLSSQSGDHGVAVNPVSAQRIEVIRGPATLLYGASAIGGLVNVITEGIPTTPIDGATGNITVDFGSAASNTGGATDIRAGNGTFAIHAAGGGRHSENVKTPSGVLQNSQSRNGFGNLGASWTGQKGYFGASYGYDDTRYGVPIVEEGRIQLTPRRHSIDVRTGGQGLTGAFDSFRASLATRRYKHEELEGAEIGTAFKNNTEEIELTGSHRALGRLKGTLGAWMLNRKFGATGEEALSPNIDQHAIAVFLYEEITWPNISLQFGGRLDHAKYKPVGENDRSFMSGSASLGLRFTPPAAEERLTFAVSLARTARNPAIEELFYLGAHPGNFAFEIGDPGLHPEHALGFDLSMRWRSSRISGEITYFRNDVQDFVFRRPVSFQKLMDRQADLAERYPNREIHLTEAEELPIVEHVGASSTLQGIEAHGDFALTSRLFAEATFDYVRGTLKATGEPLPLMPPLRGQFGLRYQYNAFQIGGNAIVAATQNRLFTGETSTDGYRLLKLFAAYSVQSDRLLHTITARIDNVTNELYRNHLSLIKNLVPEMGRDFKIIYNLGF